MKLHNQAKKVFSGKIFDTYQWEQKMYDGSFQTFEMTKRPNTVQIIPTIGDKIIVAREEQPDAGRDYSLLGGRQEADETAIEAAKRELFEESGLTCEDWQLYQTHQPVQKIDWTVYYYIARNCQKTAQPKLDPGEKIELMEVDFDQFVEIILSEEYWGSDFALHIAKLKINNQLDQLRKQIFPK